MRITKENIALFDTVRALCDNMELYESEDFYFLDLDKVEKQDIQNIIDNALYYKSLVFESYEYNVKTSRLTLTFKKITN